MSPVYLASGGVVCHTGRGLTALSQGLLKPAIRPCHRSIEELTPAIAVPYLPAVFPGCANRVVALAEAAVMDALTAFPPARRQDMALFIASSTADLIGREQSYAAAVARGEPALAWAKPSTGLLAASIARQFEIMGGQYTINTACSSGVHALMYAAAAIRRGDCARALVIGLECPGRVTFAGFHSLLLFTQSHCRPFDRNRDGLILGEAAAAIVLDAAPEGPDFTGMRLLSAATACDTSRITQIHPDAARTLMRGALRNAGIDRVDAVKAHGTGTPDNDRAEAVAIAACVDVGRVPVTSLKSVLGHTLGACGILETLAMATCWREGWLPSTAGFREPDTALGLIPVTQAQALPPGYMLLNYFGFGGNNGVLVMEYAP
ncbi:MAG: hypothetical protein L0H73_01255 [Nitrococcus sp.]|nr:hypothetical protein [Nitrococcus sp.]